MTRSGDEIKRHCGGGLSEALPTVDFAHGDLAGCEQRPEHHRRGFGRGQHWLGLDPAFERFVQSLDGIRNWYVDRGVCLVRLDWLGIPAYSATIRDEGHREHAEWAGRCVRWVENSR